MVTRGEIWWYEPQHENRRPYVILTRLEACAVLNQVIAIPLTRTVRGIPTEVGLGRADGLPSECVAALDNMTLIRPALCTEKITTLDDRRMQEICTAMGHAVDC